MKDIEKYFYRVYGLNIESEIEIEEFIKAEKQVNNEGLVQIYYGEMTSEIEEEIRVGRKMGVTKNSIWFHVDNIATYLICAGQSIICKAHTTTEWQLLKTYIMCSCLGFIMLQRGKVAIHGGTVVMGENAVIITGDRGAGKSTLTTALRQRGYKFLSDDVSATRIGKGPLVHCGFPYQKLCEDAMGNMGYNKETCKSFRSNTQVKYMVPAHNEFVEQDKPLTAIIEICKGQVDEVQIEKIRGTDKLVYVIRNLYRGEYITKLGGMKPDYFKQCVNIAKYIECYRMIRPEDGLTVGNQIHKLESTLV